jgi:hypothetical protein
MELSPIASPGREPKGHPNGVKRLSRLEIQLAGKNRRSAALERFRKIDLLDFKDGIEPLATIEFDEMGQKQILDLRPSVPLLLKY